MGSGARARARADKMGSGAVAPTAMHRPEYVKLNNLLM